VEPEGWEIANDYRPAREVGGDFFDVFPLLDPDRPRHLGVVIADVSGKGIAAALLMAFVRPIIRSALDRSGDPVTALERTNDILVHERRTGLFVTVLCGVLDLDSGLFTFANAGHEMPILASPAGTTRWVEGGGPLVGLFDSLGLAAQQVQVGPGERLILFTDGITDAASPSGERFGQDRLLATIAASCPDGDAVATCRAVIQDVLAFQADALPADDLALLVLRRLPA
jgi:sigma-B regulation protein RsbU (phosphoserine phosphatase)